MHFYVSFFLCVFSRIQNISFLFLTEWSGKERFIFLCYTYSIIFYFIFAEIQLESNIVHFFHTSKKVTFLRKVFMKVKK